MMTKLEVLLILMTKVTWVKSNIEADEADKLESNAQLSPTIQGGGAKD